MSGELMPTSAWSFPLMRFSSLADDTSWLQQNGVPSGLSITEDEEYVYVDAALPGVSTDNIEISFHNGVLRITGEMQQEERKERKSYHAMTSSYSYQVAVPGEIDLNADPEATCADGILTVTFTKVKASTPKKIAIKTKSSGRSKKVSEEKEENKADEKESAKASTKSSAKAEPETTETEAMTTDETALAGSDEESVAEMSTVAEEMMPGEEK